MSISASSPHSLPLATPTISSSRIIQKNFMQRMQVIRISLNLKVTTTANGHLSSMTQSLFSSTIHFK